MKNNYYLLLLLTILTGFLTFSTAFGQSGCNDLDITSVQDGSVCGDGRVELKATPSGTGDEVVWFGSDDVSNDTIPLFVGENFVTPKLSSTTSYWVSEALGSAVVGDVDPEKPSDIGSAGSNSTSTSYYMSFDVHDPTTLVSVDVYPSSSGMQASIEILDSSGNLLESVDYTTNVSSSDGSKVQTVSLNVHLDPGTDYRMKQGTGVSLYRNSSGASYPFSSSLIDITDNSFSAGYYYFFYNWKYENIKLDCESSREKVVATIDDVADEEVISPFPYVSNASTQDYANNYEGAPGTDCGSSDDYLDGHDVVYHFNADDDYVLNVELDSLSKLYSGVFVYNDCADIGDACAEEGSVADDSTDKHGFEMIAENGKDYYFVVSTAAPIDSLDYQLTIDRMGCNDIPAPSAEVTDPYFIAGDSLMALNAKLKGSKFNQGYRWYEDANLTDEIERPDTLSIVDQKDYYVTQTVIDCQGDALTITPQEFHCSDLDPDIITPEVELCIPGGYVTLEAQPSPVGTDVYWYDSETADDPISKEGKLDVGFVGDSTSYWVTELRIDGEAPETELGKSISDAGSSGYAPISSGYGLLFTADQAFTLVSVTVLSSGGGGDMEITLKEDDANGQIIDSKMVDVVGGGSSASPIPDELELEFEIPGAGTYYIYAGDGPNMIRDNGDSGFPYSLGSYGEITNGYSISSSATAYYFFYDWTIGAGKVICESDKKEVKINITDNFPEAPEVDSPYILCGDEVFTIKDIEVEGENLEWYDEVGNVLGDTIVVQDNVTYYVAEQASGGCMSDVVPVKILIQDISELPQAEAEQEFNAGDILASLEVNGVNLRWYADANKEEELPNDTELENETTYYVTQTRSGLCESEVLGISVVKTLGVDDLSFENIKFSPNPVVDVLFLANMEEIEEVAIYDMTGRVLLKRSIKESLSEMELDFTEYSAGVYFLNLTKEGKSKVIRVIKK